jgi:hypothetical protein
MEWLFGPWPDDGNWYTQDGVADTGQSEGVAASGVLVIEGSAETEQGQLIFGLGFELDGAVFTEQSQHVVIAGSDVLHIIGTVSTQQSQHVFVLGAPNIVGAITTGQALQSCVGDGFVEVVGNIQTHQVQSVRVAAFQDPVAINVALKRFLDYPHAAVFDKAPDRQLALRISGSQSLSWTVSRGVLSVVVDGINYKYALRYLTFSALCDMMALQGVTIDYQNPAFSSLGAHMLMDGGNDQSNSNGTHLYAYSADLWVLFAAYSVELDQAQYALLEALRQMIITQARGEWLDLWGKLYNHPRSAGKADDTYGPEIPREAFRIRVNALAIENAVYDLTGKTIRIEEPWQNMFRLNESRLSGDDRLYDGTSTGYHLIRPVSQTPIDWSDVLPVIERNRAAGVKVLEPETRLARFVDARVAGRVSSSRTDTQAALVPLVADGRLNYMELSAGSYQRNYAVMISSIGTMSLLGDNSPVSASMQYYNITGDTWRDRSVWGASTWNGDGEANSFSEADGYVPLSWVIYDTDILEI